MGILLFFLLFVHCHFARLGVDSAKDFRSTLGHLRPRASSEIQARAVHKLIERFVGEKATLFEIVIDPELGPPEKDTFKISSTPSDLIQISGTSGVAAAWGFNYYLKKFCNSHVAWEGSRVDVPSALPQVDVTVTSNDKFRYYQNVCTAGYSSTWWQWDQWEKNIDWMALNGINLALAFHGQEAIWQRVYLEMGLTVDEINEHFGGPAFLPWARMGNIRGWGGPLSPSWHELTLQLQHRILTRMRELGIIPVLPAFAGHVPRALTRIYPSANVTKIEKWNKFADKYCCPFLLAPTDPLFKTVGSQFLRKYIDEFGTDHVYNCDTFNENEPPASDLASLRNIGQAVFNTMTDVDPQAIWLMQGWLFVHEMLFWTEPRVEAFVTSVPIGKMIVLDLQSEQFPQYARLESYFGQPFIWCMLHNFGGTLGMFGSAEIVNERTFEARTMNDSTMIGTGLTPEGINQNYVIYELMNEMGYRKKPVNLIQWFEDYSTRRYGSSNEASLAAWRVLSRTVYRFSGIQRIRGHYVITRRPSLKINTWTWYNPESFYVAWDNLTSARDDMSSSIFYKHDLIDVTRQALQLKAEDIYLQIKDAYAKKNLTSLRSNSFLLLDVFDDLEKILASSENFLLGKWLRDAKSLATNPEESNQYEYNARNQITLWGPRGEIRDYANKQWSGVIVDYFKPRWSLFLGTLVVSLMENKPFNESEINRAMFRRVEEPFTFSRKMYPVKPQGNCVDVAVELNKKWRKVVIGKPRNKRGKGVSRSKKVGRM
ncbi:alpha-N-acetylglucosaminidase [Venturia canescens]|uniref:alpha-N-acetylglucosaminidase n=1 Tax=Venturia canescens TaxID=32260 RepID=UPI001C9CD080|nr:alpha-N-acetylglucosaminidase [Venturia canescens]